MPSITPIITAYRRPHTIKPLVTALRGQTVKPDRIWAWANDPIPEVAASLAGAGLDRIVTSSENTFFHARFAMAMTAPSEFVAVFDDDSIPGPNWFANCLETMDRTPGILGTAGIVLHGRGYGERTMHGWQRPSDHAVEVDLVGQVWFLRREWLPYLFVSPPVTGTNGEDIELGARLWRSAGIRSFCPPHPIADRTRWGSTCGMEFGLDQVAASVANGEKHLAERDAIVKAEIAAGWVPLFGRNCQNSEIQEEATSSVPAEVTAATADRIAGENHCMTLAGEHHAYFDPKLPSLTLVYDADQPIAHDPRHSSVTVFELPRPRHLFLTENSDIEHELSGGPYETIDVGPLLATQPNPLKFLRRVRDSLASGGKLSATFTNARHHATVGALLGGEWRPRDIDPSASSAKPSTTDHSTPDNPIRFYTRREVEKLLYRSGYTLIELAPEPCSDLERWRAAGSLGEVKIGPMHIAGLTQADAEEFYAERYNVVAVPVAVEEPGAQEMRSGSGASLISMVLVTFNALAFTQQCISGIRFLTDARNESLKHATGEWILWPDSDDVLDAENGRMLRELLSGPIPDNIFGFTMQVHCPPAHPESEHDAVVVDHCKVFRNRPDIGFEGRIHEQVLGSISRAGGEVLHTPLFVVHAGADHTPAGRRRKLARDFKLLRLELKEQPGHTFTLFNLGMTFADSKKYRKAVRALERSLAASHPGESHVRKIYALLVSSLKELGRAEEASRCCQQGLALFPKDPELHFRSGLLYHDAKRLRQAEQDYLAALANDDETHFASLDRGITGYKTRQNLAVVYAEMGALHKAEHQFRKIVEEVPSYRYGWQCLADNLLEQGRLEAADALADQLFGIPFLRGTGLVLAGQLAERRGNLSLARQLLVEAVEQSQGDERPLDELCRVLFFHGAPDEAEAALTRLVRERPDDAAAQHNLAVVYLRQGRPVEATLMFRSSLQLRPNSPPTAQLLACAEAALAREQQAA